MNTEDAIEEINSWELTVPTLNSTKMISMIRETFNKFEEFDTIFIKSKLICRSNSNLIIKPKVPSSNLVENYSVIDFSGQSLLSESGRSLSQELFNRSSFSRKYLVCKAGHQLEWDHELPFKQFEKFGSFVIKCKECEKKSYTSNWHCSTCNYSLCETCGNNKGYSAPKFKCLKNHELIWRPDICVYYKNLESVNGFNCDLCKNLKQEPSWNCMYCRYDVCILCASSKYNKNPFKNQQLCINGHGPLQKMYLPLGYINFIPNIETCSRCNMKFKDKCFKCQDCNYCICIKCIKTIKINIVGHPILSCSNRHYMRWGSSLAFMCNLCCKNYNDRIRYRCYQCDFDVCLNCAVILIYFVVSKIKINHGQKNHLLEWKNKPINSSENSLICKGCKSIKSTGMFFCNLCDMNLCVPCFGKLYSFDLKV